ncbi:gamma-glutamyl-gamma-aminobutyrate hydrolase family protein [Ferdinandcohnia quinoae]|uniref:Gamma-glutamyl-gamma-aminobutyrate hydrolase family protein n=1 Tax=Fredinandcohnia quinoae TaxID=2918902 RepID=A0AAW5E7U9_9BACI|nr:gamma-glutamyl-gamma-aminobutyrate hydrolase family protein [Fredinandcohnia sp. SECRCQ15]MCH1627004.1 gamma-glutamyl-gamma-aminobutyrate hydrolase family protein [Fredinandcohnia sp. SECRCQ15]
MKKPIIGITSHVELDYKHSLSNDYIQSVIQAGGLPVILPIGIDTDIDQLTEMIDGLVVTGGGDIDPTLFDEEPHPNLGMISPGRDLFEIAIIQHMLNVDKPILAICRGIQILNISIGGDMYQDIYSQINQNLLQHTQKATRSHLAHYVVAEESTLLKDIIGIKKFRVNTYHHQAVRNVPKPFIISGVASDGIIEAIESIRHQFVLGVQWHPEALAVKGDEFAQRIFNRFIKSC